MSDLTIEKDIEFIKNQVNYLDSFQKKINTALGNLKSFKTKWNGPGIDEPLYKEIDRWLKCYTQLKDHLFNKGVIDQELQDTLNQLPPLEFKRPILSSDEIAKKGGAAKFFYAVFPPYRISFNKKKVKKIAGQIQGYKSWVDKLRKLSYRIESVYTDGI